MSEPQPPSDDRPDLDDTPPILGSWRTIYVVVVANLAVLILVFWALSELYS